MNYNVMRRDQLIKKVREYEAALTEIFELLLGNINAEICTVQNHPSLGQKKRIEPKKSL